MNLDELRSVQSKERQKDSLQNLRPSFYQEVGEYIADLEDERDRVAEQADDPFSSPEVGRLTDEIETAKDVVEAVYERRMGKLVKQASLAAAGMPADDEGLTAEEADLFDDLVDRIGSNKSRVLDVLEGVETETESGGAEPSESGGVDPADPDTRPSTPDADPTAENPIGDPSEPTGADAPTDDAPPAPPQEPPSDVDATPDAGDSSGVTPADVMGGDGPSIDDTDAPDPGAAPTPSDEIPSDADADDGPAAVPDVDSPATPADDPTAVPDDGPASADGSNDAGIDRVTVRITRDIGSILGVDDREYSLSTDDIVTLPEQNADPLLERDAAESLE